MINKTNKKPLSAIAQADIIMAKARVKNLTKLQKQYYQSIFKRIIHNLKNNLTTFKNKVIQTK